MIRNLFFFIIGALGGLWFIWPQIITSDGWECAKDVVASSDETVESNTFGENVEEIGSNVLSILYWIWAFALLGGIGLNLRRGGPISDLGIESAVDAMLELGP